MADFALRLTIPDVKRADAFTWFEAMHPIPQIPDPTWRGDPEDTPDIDEFTSEQWMAERLRRNLVNSIATGKQKLGTPALTRDEEIVTR